ncbi:response regulator transcription factor [Streptomyces lunaelactis]|uniref:response regulator transcription factor n=1 Tax=Streptomyces lunaelactis TaxID=1535768 RepID=UPI001585B87C|nr:response regulator transcription factor [Streptomyces lunaelactis]NUJ99670.1 response regulator transcription factor [Streptomyces lunaelactis]NUK06831.1 response regulator transcription factor [Streptomyces lunaelactis]NUK14229.1 response regulator transcription factor [Streptomyces lunaelactis]NUK37159.1 response regulator transcription factor [Streptomyces lunaelactis]NUK39332.1 response regulator transcription factor [Streptomyces lunaelactis]
MTPIRMVIVDDHEVFRNGLRDYAEVAGIHVVGEAGNAAEAVDVVLDTEPDVVVMDLEMAGGDGLTAIRALAGERPDLPVVVVSGYDEGSRVSDALRAGAAGFVLKTCSAPALLAALGAAARGLTVLDHTARSHLFGALEAARTPAASPFPSLSGRERQVLTLLAQGKEPSRIARELFLDPHTVHNYLSSVVRKLGVAGRNEAAEVARAHGLGNGSGSQPGDP